MDPYNNNPYDSDDSPLDLKNEYDSNRSLANTLTLDECVQHLELELGRSQ